MHRWSSFYRKRSTTYYVCMYVCMCMYVRSAISATDGLLVLIHVLCRRNVPQVPAADACHSLIH